ncbi:DNA topoisomerase VI subunit A [Aureococcus anophagefferens]|nr:DNA topoisomerase VI subunit A [Aureococcus anophagefferens]
MEDLEEEQDVTAWVNGVLSEASADGASVDAKISSVSMKLQIMAADLNDELEGHMEELIEAAPRALGDVGSVSRARADEAQRRAAAATASRGASGKLDAAADRGPGGLEDCAAAHAACGVFLENLEQTLGLPAQSPLLGDVAFAVGGAPFAGFGEMGSDGATRYGALERRRFAAAVAVGAADCRAALDALPADGLLPAAAFEAALDRARKLLDAALADDCRAALGRCAALTGGLDGAGCAAAVRDATRRALRSPRDVAADAGRGRDAAFSEDEGLARVPPLARRAVAAPPRRRGGAAEASPLDRVAVDRALDDLAAEASALAFECAFAPVRSALRRVSAARLGGGAQDKAAPYYCRAAVWAGNDDADPAPSDYATVVGEHLMGALRHLEPFLESPAVADAAAVHVDAGGRLTDVREWERIGDVLDADRLGLRALAAGEPLAGAHLGGDALAESSAPEDAARPLLLRRRQGPRGADHAFLAHLDAVATAAYEGRLPELLLRPMAQTPAAAALASLEAALRAKLDAPVEAAVEAAVDDGAEAPPADEAPPEDH